MGVVTYLADGALGITVRARVGLNNYTGPYYSVQDQIVEGITDENGEYMIGLPSGNYTLEFTSPSIDTIFQNITVGEDVFTHQDIAIPPDFGPTAMKAKITWNTASDLDLQMYAVGTDGIVYRVYYDDRAAIDTNGELLAFLEKDVFDYGPEIIDFRPTVNRIYSSYSGFDDGLAASITTANGAVYTATAPVGPPGNYWWIADVIGNNVTIIDQVVDTVPEPTA